MTPWLRRVAVIMVLLGAPLAAHAQPADPTMDQPMADPAQEARARAFMREIRCVVCQCQYIYE